MQTIEKLKILWLILTDAYDGWKNYVWDHDLDERYCCDGRGCNCGGITIREIYNAR